MIRVVFPYLYKYQKIKNALQEGSYLKHQFEVLSEKNDGTHEINNLRPICFACNHLMGAENMIEFVVKYGLYIG
jgi:hypothetical protein